jgi:hypothetical protein
MNAAWPAFLHLLRSQKDFGMMDIDQEAVLGWNNSTRARDMMISILDEISDRALEVVGNELRRGGSIAPNTCPARFRTNKKRRVWPWKDRLNLQIAISGDSAERLRIQFLGGMAGGPYFTVEARHPDARPFLNDPSHPVSLATHRLLAGPEGFKTGRDWETFWTKTHPPDEWLSSGPEIHEVLLDLIRADVRALVASGIFAALPPGKVRESVPPPDVVGAQPLPPAGTRAVRR